MGTSPGTLTPGVLAPTLGTWVPGTVLRTLHLCRSGALYTRSFSLL